MANAWKPSSRASKRSFSTTWKRENDSWSRSTVTVPRSMELSVHRMVRSYPLGPTDPSEPGTSKRAKPPPRFAVDLDQNGRGFALSADGKRVAVPNFDVKSIDIFERLTGKRLRNIPVDEWFSDQHLAFSADGRFLASIVGSRRSAQVWEVDTGAHVLKVKAGNTCNTVAGAFSPDSRTFAFGDGGRSPDLGHGHLEGREWLSSCRPMGNGMDGIQPRWPHDRNRE